MVANQPDHFPERHQIIAELNVIAACMQVWECVEDCRILDTGHHAIGCRLIGPTVFVDAADLIARMAEEINARG